VSLKYVGLTLYENSRLYKIMASMDGTNDFQVVRRLCALYSILVGPWVWTQSMIVWIM